MTTEQTILAMEQQRRQAMVQADVPALQRLLSDRLMWIHGTGRPDTKAGVIGSIGSGKTQYQSIDCSDESVRFFGPVAVVSGVAVMNAVIAGEPRVLNNRFTILWEQQPHGDWQAVNWQSTGLRPA